jgi:hypothetical protein
MVVLAQEKAHSRQYYQSNTGVEAVLTHITQVDGH